MIAPKASRPCGFSPEADHRAAQERISVKDNPIHGQPVFDDPLPAGDTVFRCDRQESHLIGKFSQSAL